MDLFKIFGTIALNGVDQFNSEVDDATEKGKDLASAIGKGLQTAAKIGTAAVTAAATAVSVLLKKSIQNYAEYEQLVGGVETLFKNSSATIMGYANDAFRTAGMSANEYMSTVTSFSASLLQGLGGDTAQAAEIANLAITDMSDNANKMGTDMAAIQNAYQGFAKQNYTMLDNLKLGYGGTASEMARLINDSGVLGDTIEVTAETVNSVSFDNIIKAINVVQTQMGITGTTAKEAMTTIQGSVAATKAAWTNLVTGIADENADLDVLINNFAESASTALGNILPRIKQVISGIAALGDKVPVFGLLSDAIKATAVVLAAAKIGKLLQTIVTGFQAAQLQLALYTLANGEAAIASGVLTGALTAKEIVVGVLTGKISLATAAQAAWNAVMSANPITLVVMAVAALTAGIVKLSKKQDETIAGMVGVAESAEEAAAKVEELKDKIAKLEESDPAWWTEAMYVEYNNLRLALAQAEAQYQSFAEQQEAAAESAADPVNKLQEATDAYRENATTLLDTFRETYSGIFENVGSWFAPFAEATTTVKTSVNDMMAAMQSQIEFNATYSQNLQSLKEYGLGSLSEAFQSYGADGAAYAAAIVKAVEEAGGATSEGGQQIISDFAELNSEVESSQSELAETMTLMSGEFDTEIQNMVTSLAEGVEGLNKGDEAYVAAVTTLEEYLEGINAMAPSIVSAVSGLAQQVASALQTGIGVTPLPGGGGGGGMTTIRTLVTGRRLATGLDRVPYDEYPALLHKDEAVLTAEEAAAWRAGKSMGNSSTEDNSMVVGVLRQILDAIQNGGNQETVIKLNSREFGRLVRGVV